MNKQIDKIVMSGLFIAIGATLPQLFHVAGLGVVISPMHFPVILAGLILGAKYGFAVGILTPLVTSLIFSRPPIFPTGLSMALELCVYGFVSGLINSRFKFSNNLYLNLYLYVIAAMVLGRVVAIITNFLLYLTGVSDNAFLPYLSILFITALPGIILQILMIPPLYLRVKKTQL